MCRGGVEKLDIQVMAPYVATNEQFNEAGAAAMLAKNDTAGQGQWFFNFVFFFSQKINSLIITLFNPNWRSRYSYKWTAGTTQTTEIVSLVTKNHQFSLQNQILNNLQKWLTLPFFDQ